MVNWLFRNRRTGELTIMQAPNAPLLLWLVATLIKVIFNASGRLGTALTVFAIGELIIWAGDEVIRGVNPFRRAVGAVVLVVIAI
ncbi:MAG: hypothetical protein QOI44_2000, partial [Actinomycetota bacterium]|nr:hypothetical protein [Actinomycetota bacterium]